MLAFRAPFRIPNHPISASASLFSAEPGQERLASHLPPAPPPNFLLRSTTPSPLRPSQPISTLHSPLSAPLTFLSPLNLPAQEHGSPFVARTLARGPGHAQDGSHRHGAEPHQKAAAHPIADISTPGSRRGCDPSLPGACDAFLQLELAPALSSCARPRAAQPLATRRDFAIRARPCCRRRELLALLLPPLHRSPAWPLV
jgi:hypothetical protein